jgi:hypothetical protein
VEFVPRSGRAIYCTPRCRKLAFQVRRKGAGGLVVRVSVPDLPVTGPVLDALVAVLAARGLQRDPRARALLVLAVRLDDPVGETGSSLSALHRQFDAGYAALTGAAAVPAADPVDELEERRARRLAE